MVVQFDFVHFQVMSVAIISVLRCVVSMTVNASVTAGDIADKVNTLIHRHCPYKGLGKVIICAVKLEYTAILTHYYSFLKLIYRGYSS